jgi:iron complex outermembrane receptor protein
MKNIFILLVFIISTLQISAQTLSGKVYDADTKEALPGVIVYIPELQVSALTDTAGHYRISNLPKKSFLVQVTLLGYTSITQTIDLSAITRQDFAMKESATLGNEVVITGVSQATEIKMDPVPMSSIDHLYIQQNMSSNAIDALVKIPGVTAVTTGPNVSKPFIRGLGYNRVLTVFDGQRQEGQQWGDEHGIEVDQYGIDREEVIKGPASLMYGSDALAGVVSILPTPAAPEGKIIGNLLNEYETNNGLIGNSLMLAGNNNGFTWMARVSHKMAEDYQNSYDGRNYNTAFQETDASLSLGINKSWGYSHLNFGVFDDLQEIPDGSRDSATGKFTKQITEADTYRPIVPGDELNTYAISALHQHVQLYRAYDNSEFLLHNNSKLDVSIGYEGSIRREFSHPTAPTVAGLYLTLNTLTYDINYHFADLKGWKPVIGVNGMYQINNSSMGTEAIIPSYQLFDLGGFAVVSKSFKKVELSGGARYDVRSFNNAGMYIKTNPATGFGEFVNSSDTEAFAPYKTTFSGFTGSIGASYSISDKLILKGNVARGFRAPNIAEISANGVHPGTNFYQLGNPDFKPEFSLQEDLGIAFTSNILEFTFDLFNNNISNYIYNEQLLNSKGKDSVIVPGNTTFKFTQSQAELYGGELSLDIHLTKWLHFENAASYVSSINLGDGKQPVTDSTKYLPFTPPFHIISDLRATFNKAYAHFTHIFAKVEVIYYAAQNNVFSAYGTETPTPGYNLLNAGFGTDITNKAGKTICNVSVLGNNLMDVDYQDHLSRLKYFGYDYVTGRKGMFNMGRNIGFKLIIPLDLKTYKTTDGA